MAAVEFSIRIGGESFPSSSIWVRNTCAYDQLFEENASQRPLGEKLCHEFIRLVLHFNRRACPHGSVNVHIRI